MSGLAQVWGLMRASAGAIIFLVLLFFFGAPPVTADAPELRDVSRAPLSDVASAKAPWRRIEAGSEQMPPLYLGASARELALGKGTAEKPALRASLKPLGEAHALVLAQKLDLPTVELEAWPVSHWRGHWTWAFARYRRSAQEPFRWFPSGFARRSDFESPAPELPAHYLPWKKSGDEQAVFRDFLESSDLYEKPRFGECVWTDDSGAKVAAAWLPPGEVAVHRERLLEAKYHAYAIPQPARFNDRAVTFLLRVDQGRVHWPKHVHWSDDSPAEAKPLDLPAVVTAWPEDFDSRYRKDVELLSGDRFTRKSSAQPDHQLDELVAYLESRYRVLGVRAQPQKFAWRGIAQANLVARIPGSLPADRNRPVLLADHIDTAFSEDIFQASGERQTTPGADDNVTATAALLGAAGIAAGLAREGRLLHDVWLVHFTGEEFPADCLGARHFVSRLLEERREIGGLVLMDMIGYRKPGDPIFQVNAGHGDASVRLASVMLAVASKVAPDLQPAFRSRFDGKSYLYNTDGIIFSDAGYPVVLLDEHINALHIEHPHYHQSSDVPANVDFAYATALARVAIETALRIAATETLPTP